MVSIEDVREMLGNNRLIVLPFHRSHIDRLDLSKADLELFDLTGDREAIYTGMEQSDSWTVFYELQPIVAFGYESKWPGNAEAWMLPGKGAIENPHILTRGARRFFDKIGARLNLRRIQIVVCVERNHAVQWARFLKFKEEGLMKAYGPDGLDYYMFARTY